MKSPVIHEGSTGRGKHRVERGKLTRLILGNVDVGVHAEDTRVSDVGQTTNIVEVRLVIAVRRHVVDVAVVVQVIRLFVDDFRTVELGEDRLEGSTVPVVGDSTAVVALTCQVLECFVLHLCVTSYNAGRHVLRK